LKHIERFVQISSNHTTKQVQKIVTATAFPIRFANGLAAVSTGVVTSSTTAPILESRTTHSG
jgi:hypothetical protein